jgi:hypothetical protein
VGLSLFTLQITHKIEEDIDLERDFVVGSVVEAEPQAGVGIIEQFSSGYHARNGGGDRIRTDGDLPVLDLRAVPATSGDPRPDADDVDPEARPASATAGAAIALLRAAAYVALVVVLYVDPGHTTFFADFGLSEDDIDQVTEVLAAGLAVAALVDAALGVAVLFRFNWARIGLMTVCASTALAGLVASIGRAGHPIGLASLPSLGASVLVLLALSSPAARAWATEPRAAVSAA